MFPPSLFLYSVKIGVKVPSISKRSCWMLALTPLGKKFLRRKVKMECIWCADLRQIVKTFYSLDAWVVACVCSSKSVTSIFVPPVTGERMLTRVMPDSPLQLILPSRPPLPKNTKNKRFFPTPLFLLDLRLENFVSFRGLWRKEPQVASLRFVVTYSPEQTKPVGWEAWCSICG